MSGDGKKFPLPSTDLLQDLTKRATKNELLVQKRGLERTEELSLEISKQKPLSETSEEIIKETTNERPSRNSRRKTAAKKLRRLVKAGVVKKHSFEEVRDRRIKNLLRHEYKAVGKEINQQKFAPGQEHLRDSIIQQLQDGRKKVEASQHEWDDASEEEKNNIYFRLMRTYPHLYPPRTKPNKAERARLKEENKQKTENMEVCVEERAKTTPGGSGAILDEDGDMTMTENRDSDEEYFVQEYVNEPAERRLNQYSDEENGAIDFSRFEYDSDYYDGVATDGEDEDLDTPLYSAEEIQAVIAEAERKGVEIAWAKLAGKEPEGSGSSKTSVSALKIRQKADPGESGTGYGDIWLTDWMQAASEHINPRSQEFSEGGQTGEE
ncbi:MAG: hypothetical protein MMC33_009808 [Icmadophila ericetorum]|nr:hypothetical protein [Icmadophila ericetorum]